MVKKFSSSIIKRHPTAISETLLKIEEHERGELRIEHRTPNARESRPLQWSVLERDVESTSLWEFSSLVCVATLQFEGLNGEPCLKDVLDSLKEVVIPPVWHYCCR